MLDPSKIAELRGLMEKATPGPRAINERRSESRDEHGVVNAGWIIAEYEGPDARVNLALDVALRNALPELLRAAEEGARMREALTTIATLSLDMEYYPNANGPTPAQAMKKVAITALPAGDSISDGHGSSWPLCGPNCSLAVVRPGKVQCNEDAPACPERAGGGA